MNAKLLGFKGMVKDAKVLRERGERPGNFEQRICAASREGKKITGKMCDIFCAGHATKPKKKIVDAPTKSRFEKRRKGR